MNSLKAQILTVLIVLSQGLQSHSSSLESFASHVIDDLAKLPLDRNGRLDDNWFLYQDTPSCENAFKAAWLRERPDFRQIAPCTSNITEIFFGPAKSICSAVAFVKGTKPDLLTHVLPTHQLIATDIDTVEDVTAWVQGKLFFVIRDKISFRNSVNHDIKLIQYLMSTHFRFLPGHQTVEAGFLSHEAADMKLIWINPTNSERINSGTLKFGEVNTIWTGTRLGHKFELVDDVSNELIATYTIQHDSFFVVGEIDSRIHDRDVSTQVENIFNGEWERSKKIKRTFTELGFSLGKLPLDLWGSISAYYYNNRNSKADEEWNSKGMPSFSSISDNKKCANYLTWSSGQEYL